MPPSTPFVERFLNKISPCPNTGCWWWGGTCSGGYGYIKTSCPSKMSKAHRVSYELHKGSIPEGMCVCHSCDQPSCVNPDHLWIGSHAENMEDMGKKGRATGGYKGVTHCKHGHEFTHENTGVKLRKSGVSRRYCKKCNAADGRRSRRNRARV